MLCHKCEPTDLTQNLHADNGRTFSFGNWQQFIGKTENKRSSTDMAQRTLIERKAVERFNLNAGLL